MAPESQKAHVCKVDRTKLGEIWHLNLTYDVLSRINVLMHIRAFWSMISKILGPAKTVLKYSEFRLFKCFLSLGGTVHWREDNSVFGKI